MTASEAKLLGVLRSRETLAIAVSGGVDSVTLAVFAHRHGHIRPAMFHAVSPAVPAHATGLVKDYARREGWSLTILDAREFDDPAYRANPVNRCYFCKTNLYDRIGAATAHTIASGTNVDDLGDFRPGLKAAAERAVIHPYVMAGMDKCQVRRLARSEGLEDISELPAQPCLSSRIETGIEIEAVDLAFVEGMERDLAALLAPSATLRCRVRRSGITIEIEAVSDAELAAIETLARGRCRDAGRSYGGVKPYLKSSAFIHEGR